MITNVFKNNISFVNKNLLKGTYEFKKNISLQFQ